MSTFPECPNCENKEKDDSIWTCGDCGLVHCAECDDDGNCPSCGSGNMRKSGIIDPSIEDDSTDNEFSECPRCEKSDEGDLIWQCKECDCIHCEDCSPDDGTCPNCESRSLRIVGHIE